MAIVGIGLCPQLGVATVPTVLSSAYLLGGGFVGKWRKRWAGRGLSPDRLEKIEIATHAGRRFGRTALIAHFQWSQKVTVVAPDTIHILGEHVCLLAFAVRQTVNTIGFIISQRWERK